MTSSRWLQLLTNSKNFFLSHSISIGLALCKIRILRYHPPHYPLQKLQTQQNRDTQRWTNRIFCRIFVIVIIFRYRKKGIGGQHNPKQKGGEKFNVGGFQSNGPPPSIKENRNFRTHPGLAGTMSNRKPLIVSMLAPRFALTLQPSLANT